MKIQIPKKPTGLPYENGDVVATSERIFMYKILSENHTLIDLESDSDIGIICEYPTKERLFNNLDIIGHWSARDWALRLERKGN